ncbi:MAG: 1-acyl-sn-glycerol-3-phosphate acyltransferase [Bacteroidales bacterium]|jgi:hypothetical protein|nr:1-acyl-sn-glycerol-3-phosphate acyltransferase [Bacteroidales bacterium]
MYNPDFDEISPIKGAEFPEAVERLLGEKYFRAAIEYALPDVDFNEFSRLMRSCKTTYDFQIKLVCPALFGIADRTTSGLSIDGLERVSAENPAIFISNHRDIILDAAFFNILILRAGFDSTEIAIGDNLLIFPWIKDLVRINKSFIVQRGVSARQILEASKRLSGYIHYVIKEKKSSVWISQREGRAKDANDRTQDSLLKMLNLGGEHHFLENIKSLNIIPLSFSYEYDPCDYLKAKEFQMKRDDPDYKKQKNDDLLNMQTGIFGFKGTVKLQLGTPINTKIDAISPNMDRNTQAAQVGKLIDSEIHRNYSIYSVNYMAFDKLEGETRFAHNYTPNERTAFEHYIDKQLDKIDIPNKDINFLTVKLLEMYANPLKNKLIAMEL